MTDKFSDMRLDQQEPEGPTDDKLMDIACATDLVYCMGKGCGFASPYVEETNITAKVLAFARAVIAKYGTPTPQPPAAGEVTELVVLLRAEADDTDEQWLRPDQLRRAAYLLQRQHPQPVAVSERPWEREGWCDEQGQCWLRRRYEQDGVTWRLMTPAPVSDDAMQTYYAEALPAHALPHPEAP